MSEQARISDAELEVMAVLWADPPLLASDVANRVPADRGWSLQTVKTMLARLVDKGVIAAEGQGRRYLYRPLIDREQVAQTQAGRLVDRLFGGRVSPLVAQLAERRDLSAEDIAALEQIVRDLRK